MQAVMQLLNSDLFGEHPTELLWNCPIKKRERKTEQYRWETVQDKHLLSWTYLLRYFLKDCEIRDGMQAEQNDDRDCDLIISLPFTKSR